MKKTIRFMFKLLRNLNILVTKKGLTDEEIKTKTQRRFTLLCLSGAIMLLLAFIDLYAKSDFIQFLIYVGGIVFTICLIHFLYLVEEDNEN